YLEALCEDNVRSLKLTGSNERRLDALQVDFIPTPIKRITPTGIETEDGKHEDVDILVCATGFDMSFRFGFPIVGRNGVDLSDKNDPYPRTYLAIATEGFPNWFQTLGPNAAVGAGSLLVIVEKQVDYVVAATLKLQRERLKSIETVFSEKCRSWYKAGKDVGRVIALWPGSSLHAARALEHPRWEDYNYEPLDGPVKNRMYWLGDGQTVDNKSPNGDKAWYLKDIDYPPGFPMATEIKQLLDLIASSVSRLLQACEDNKTPFPDPNQPYTPQSEMFRACHDVVESTNTIAAAALQLTTRVLPPYMSLMHIVSAHFKTAALRTALELNVTEILREAGPQVYCSCKPVLGCDILRCFQGMHVDDIAEICDVDSNKLSE
ncbi:hypothetical protein C0993_006878, partial [Termitomyces sp. T159_Od127]